jgi:hypothetical protein
VQTTTLEDISADRHAGSTKLHRSRGQRTSSVTGAALSMIGYARGVSAISVPVMVATRCSFSSCSA